MKFLQILSIVVLFTALSGCSSYSTGELRSSYSPLPIGVTDPTEAATIKAASGLTIWRVDKKRQVNFVSMMFGRGLDSVSLPEGKHTIGASIKGTDINFPSVVYKAGHEYLIDYVLKKEERVYYWIKDLTDNNVVFGKEITVDELKK